MVQRVQVVAGNTPQKAHAIPESETPGPGSESPFGVGATKEHQLTRDPALPHRQVVRAQDHVEVFVRFIVRDHEDEW
jgi:hypothetical protein